MSWISYDADGNRRDWRAPTEDSVAEKLAEAEAGRLRYCHGAQAWFAYDGALWRRDRTGLVTQRVRELARERAADPGGKVVAAAGRPAFVAGVLRLARDDPALAVTAEAWDADPHLLGTPAGPIDLRSGAPAPADPADGISRATAVAPAMPGDDCPAWRRFLDAAFCGDAALIDFVQRVLGYALTGSTSEQVALFGWGAGGTGKTVFLKTVLHVMGDYATPAEPATLTSVQAGRHAAGLVALRGVRLAALADADAGWASRQLPRLTGGDPIALGDGRAFTPAFKLLAMGRKPPRLTDPDAAARLCVVPFRHSPTLPDRGLAERLRAEAPAILRWMIDGCLAWQADGLGRPRAVDEATAACLEEPDTVTLFLAERCACAEDATIAASDLWRAWCAFAEAAGEPAGSHRQLAEALVARGIRRDRTNAARFYRGVALREAVTGDSGDS